MENIKTEDIKMEDIASTPKVNTEPWTADSSTHAEIFDKYQMFDDFEGSDNPELHNAISEATEDEQTNISDDSDDSNEVDEVSYQASSETGEGNDAEATTEVAGSLEAEATVTKSTDPIVQSLSLPHNFSSLESLLYHPKHGVHTAEASMKVEEQNVTELKEQRDRIKALLKEAKARLRASREEVVHAKDVFSNLQNRLGISNELWKEYKAFCESLEPRFGSRNGWSVTCFSNHHGCYVKWDPTLELFVGSAEMSLTNCNFRCEAVRYIPKQKTLVTDPRTGITFSADMDTDHDLPPGTFQDGQQEEYVVQFWPVPAPEPRTGTEKTWGEQYVSRPSYS